MADLWAFLSDQGNQATLSLLGGGLVVLAGGVWAVIKFFAGQKEKENYSIDLPRGSSLARKNWGDSFTGSKVLLRRNHSLHSFRLILLALTAIGSALLIGSLLGRRITATGGGFAAGGDVSINRDLIISPEVPRPSP